MEPTPTCEIGMRRGKPIIHQATLQLSEHTGREKDMAHPAKKGSRRLLQMQATEGNHWGRRHLCYDT